MLVMVTMLGIGLLPTGDQLWVDQPWKPALCVFRKFVARSREEHFKTEADVTGSMLISLIVLFSGYLTRLIKLSKQATAFTKRWIRTNPGRPLKNALMNSIQRAGEPNAMSYWRLKHLILEIAYVLLRVCYDIYESTLWEVRSFRMVPKVIFL